MFLCSDRIFPSHGTPCLSLFTLARPVSSLALFFFQVRRRNKLVPLRPEVVGDDGGDDSGGGDGGSNSGSDDSGSSIST